VKALRSEDKAMASMPKYQIVAILSDLGFRPCEIASTLYPEEKNRKKALTRVTSMLWRLKRKNTYHVMEKPLRNYVSNNVMYNSDGDPKVAYDSVYYPKLPQNAPFSDGTLDIKSRKMWANEFERQRAEYEQLLYYLYNAVLRRADDDMKTMWQSIKLVFLETFREFYDKFHVKYYHSKRRKYVKEATAAYIYYVFFFALKDFYEFLRLRRLLVKRILGMVRDKDKYEQVKKEVITLFAKY